MCRQMSSPADDTPLDMSDWESVSMDRANWTLLVKQLEDLLALSCLLAMRPSPPVTPTTPGSESLCSDIIEVSVKKVLEGGRGAFNMALTVTTAYNIINYLTYKSCFSYCVKLCIM